MNYFELLGLPIQFELDGSLLSSQYRILQRQCHPDNFATASERDRLLAVQQAAQVNDAYQTLKSPIARAEYLIKLAGIDMAGEQTTLQDGDFLLSQMMLREELEGIQDEDTLFDFEQRVDQSYQAGLDQVQDLLTQTLWPQAAEQVRKLKFIAKLRYEIEQVEARLLG